MTVVQSALFMPIHKYYIKFLYSLITDLLDVDIGI